VPRLFPYNAHTPSIIDDEKVAGRFLLRYGGDLTSIRNYLTLGVLRFGSDLMLVALAVGILTLLDVRLGLIFFSILGLFLGLVLVLNRFLHDKAQFHRDRKSGLLSFVQKRFELLTTIKAFNRIGKEQQRFEKRSGRVYQAAMAYHQWNSLIRAMIPFLSHGLIVFLLLFSLSGDAGHLSVSMLLILTIQPVLRRLFLVGSTWEKGKISYAKLDRVFQYTI
ncbi:MAG: ABC transporter transmembrane domain-containing protein, partial [Bacteroidota bacterium]